MADNIAPAVVKQRTRVVSWCSVLTKRRSADNDNELTKVGGVLSVVIYGSKCSFCKLGPTLSKFHLERNDLSVGASGQRAERTVL